MKPDALHALLRAVAAGQTPPEAAADRIAGALDARRGFVDLDFAKVDIDRHRRRGIPEVVFGPGKAPAQVAGIARALYVRGQRVLVTRLDDPDPVLAELDGLPAEYDPDARCLVIQDEPTPITGQGTILVVAAGTSDRPVAAEAAKVAALCGNRVEALHDVGVAGLHRLLAHIDRLRAAAVIIVVAGMEGALPSVVAGLVDRPVIGVPTSVGYGANLGGMTALLSMVNSCAAGLTVVNIDNGFGAAYAATLMNRAPAPTPEQ